MSVALPPSLLFELDNVIAVGEYGNCSEATRDALRALVTEFNQQTRLFRSLSGTVVVLYEHNHSGVSDGMTELQHDFTETTITVHHVHLGNHLCLKSIVVDGTDERIGGLFSRIRPPKGIHQARLTVVEADRQRTSRERL